MFEPLTADALTPTQLKATLDEAGNRHRLVHPVVHSAAAIETAAKVNLVELALH